MTAENETIAERLEYLRSQLDAECISYGELAELEDLAPHIDEGDVQLLEAAGVPEFPYKLWIETTDSHGEEAGARWGRLTEEQVDAVLAFAVETLGQPDTTA